MFLISMSESAAMTIIPLLECVACQPRVGAGGPIVFHHLGPVDDSLCQAVSIHGAFSTSETITSFYSWGRVFGLLYLSLVFFNFPHHIIPTSVGDLDCVSINNF